MVSKDKNIGDLKILEGEGKMITELAWRILEGDAKRPQITFNHSRK